MYLILLYVIYIYIYMCVCVCVCVCVCLCGIYTIGILMFLLTGNILLHITLKKYTLKRSFIC